MLTNNHKVNAPGDLDLLLPWLALVRAARSSGISNGYSIVRLLVLVDEHGNPVQYGEIKTTKLSPLSKREALECILAELSGE